MNPGYSESVSYSNRFRGKNNPNAPKMNLQNSSRSYLNENKRHFLKGTTSSFSPERETQPLIGSLQKVSESSLCETATLDSNHSTKARKREEHERCYSVDISNGQRTGEKTVTNPRSCSDSSLPFNKEKVDALDSLPSFTNQLEEHFEVPLGRESSNIDQGIFTSSDDQQLATSYSCDSKEDIANNLQILAKVGKNPFNYYSNEDTGDALAAPYTNNDSQLIPMRSKRSTRSDAPSVSPERKCLSESCSMGDENQGFNGLSACPVSPRKLPGVTDTHQQNHKDLEYSLLHPSRPPQSDSRPFCSERYAKFEHNADRPEEILSHQEGPHNQSHPRNFSPNNEASTTIMDENNTRRNRTEKQNRANEAPVASSSSDKIPSIRIKALISSSKAGTIIGKQGNVINSLRAESHCRISMSDDLASRDRLLTVTGPYTNVAAVLRRICFIIGSSSSFSKGSRNPSGQHSDSRSFVEIESLNKDSDSKLSSCSSSLSQDEQRGEALCEENSYRDCDKFLSDSASPPQYNKFHLENESPAFLSNDPKRTSSPPMYFIIAVPSPHCGCLIGKKGSQIRIFREKFGVSFSVSSSPISESLDRPVTVSGPFQRVADCLGEVCRLLAFTSTNSNDVGSPYSTESSVRYEFRENYYKFDEEPLPNCAATEITNCKTGSQGYSRHARSKGARDSYNNYSGSYAGQKNFSDLDNSTKDIYNRIAWQRHPYSKSSQPRRSLVTHQDSESSEMLGNSILECSFALNNGEIEVHLLVPNDIVGCIIGKGGKTISEIRETSRAHISIGETQFPPLKPYNAVSTLVYTSAKKTESIHSKGSGGVSNRQRDRVILIRGMSEDVGTARYLMGSSIVSARKANAKPSNSSCYNKFSGERQQLSHLANRSLGTNLGQKNNV